MTDTRSARGVTERRGASPAPLQVRASAPRPAYAWYVLAVLTLAYVSSFIDRQTLFLLVAPIRRDLAISDFEMSLLMGISFALFYSVLGLPIGRLADRRSRRGIIGWGIALWSVMTAACGLAQSYGQLFLARVGVGVGEAALSPPAYSLLADYFPRNRIGTAIGIYSLGIYLGSGLSMMLGGWLIGTVAGQEIWNVPVLGAVRPWQTVFLAIGLPGLLIALLMFTVREPRRGAMSDDVVVDPVPLGEVLGYMSRHRRAFLGHNLGFALIALVNYGWAAWVPAWLGRIHGWSAQQVGLVYGLWTATFGVAGVVAGGYLGDRLAARGHPDAKLKVGLIGIAGELLSGLLFLLAPTEWMEWALIPSTFFASFGFGAAAAAIQEITPVPMRAQASAVYLFLVSLIGLGVGPSLVAWFTDHFFRSDQAIGGSLLVVTISGLALAALALFLALAPFREAVRTVSTWRPVPSVR